LVNPSLGSVRALVQASSWQAMRVFDPALVRPILPELDGLGAGRPGPAASVVAQLLSHKQSGIERQMSAAPIVSLLIAIRTGSKPARRTFETIPFYLLGWVSDEEFDADVRRWTSISPTPNHRDARTAAVAARACALRTDLAENQAPFIAKSSSTRLRFTASHSPQSLCRTGLTKTGARGAEHKTSCHVHRAAERR
jgi:hypothetical protein